MLVMRPEQLEALSHAQLQRVDLDLTRFARARFPSQAQQLGEQALHARVTATREQCQAFGFESTSAFALGLDFSLMYGEDWVDAPWAVPMLNARMLPERVRLEALRKSQESARQ